MKIKREFTVDFLTEELGLPYDAYDGCEVFRNKVVDTSRWSIHYELVFHFEDKYYMTWYSEGATEQQDERPCEYDDIVVCYEVTPIEKVVTVFKYKEVKDGA